MDKGQVAVLTRKYKHHSESVVTAVIKYPDDNCIDTLGVSRTRSDFVKLYLEAKKNKIIRDFVSFFPEFGDDNTKWVLTVIDLQ